MPSKKKKQRRDKDSAESFRLSMQFLNRASTQRVPDAQPYINAATTKKMRGEITRGIVFGLLIQKIFRDKENQ